MKILVTGGSGQLGKALGRHKSDHEIILCDRETLNIENHHSVLQAVETILPDAIINCAAWTDVDGCEAAIDKALNVNGYAVDTLRNVAQKIGIKLVQISTDYVFDGKKDRPYLETDAPNPLSVYGQSKLLGEKLATEEALTIRTSWIFSEDENNIVQTILKQLSSNKEFLFVNDQFGCPTYAQDIVAPILALIESSASGIFHVTNSDPVSWYQFACEIAELTESNSSLIVPISSIDLIPPRAAKRPTNSILENAALRNSGLPPLRSHLEALGAALQNISEANDFLKKF